MGGVGGEGFQQETRQRPADLDPVDDTLGEAPVWTVQGAAAGDPVTGEVRRAMSPQLNLGFPGAPQAPPYNMGNGRRVGDQPGEKCMHGAGG